MDRTAEISGRAVDQAACEREEPSKPHELGALLLRFHQPYRDRALGFACVACASAIASASCARHPAQLIGFFLAPLFIAIALFILYYTFILGRLEVRVHASGVRIDRWRRSASALWTEITHVFVAEDGLRLRLGSGEEIAIESSDPALGPVRGAIFERAMAVIGVRSAADFHCGLDLDFGALSLSKRRVALVPRRIGSPITILPFERIGRIAVERGRFRIDESGDDARTFCDLPIGEIANFTALETLLARARRG